MITPAENGVLTREDQDKYCDRIIEFVERYEITKDLAGRGGGIRIDKRVLLDVIRKTHDDLHRYTKSYNIVQNINVPDHFKQAGHLAFWIRRLRPLYFDDLLASTEHEGKSEISVDYLALESIYINEKFALMLAAVISIAGEESKDRIPARRCLRGSFHDDLVVMCRYKSISPHALMMALRGYFGNDDKECVKPPLEALLKATGSRQA